MPKKIGFFTHPGKPIFTPSQNMISLDCNINTHRKVVANDMTSNETITEEIVSLLRNLVVSVEAAQYGRLYYRHQDNDKITAFNNSKVIFDTP